MFRHKSAQQKWKKRPLSISRLMALVFLALIFLGAVLLNLPLASRDGRSIGFMSALFTATSATCVTGLTVVDTWTQWSPFGQCTILGLIEIGGLGFMSVAFVVFATLRRKISIQQQMVMAEAIGATSQRDILAIWKSLLIRAVALEGSGAVILTLRFLQEYSFPVSLRLGVFHSVSAFCNAGFDILGFRGAGESMITYQRDPVILLTLSALIILGGLGFLVWDEVLRERNPRKWSVYTRLVLLTTGVLLFGGMALFCLLEWENPGTLGSMNAGEKLLAAFFQSATLRTAGFAGLSQEALTSGGKAFSIFLMLIGGSSGSTAGGMKTVTFVVLFLFLWNRIRGRYTVSVFNRTISDDHVLNAITIFILMVTLAFFGGAMIAGTCHLEFTDSLYEAMSAIGTVGLSAGITSKLKLPARVMIMVFMYFGRVGVLTISFGFLKKKPAGENYRYARTELLIG